MEDHFDLYGSKSYVEESPAIFRAWVKEDHRYTIIREVLNFISTRLAYRSALTTAKLVVPQLAR